jgi:hypothetical protein
MVLIPPSLALIFRQRLESIWAVVRITFANAKARQFYSLYYDLQVVFGELVMVFGELEGGIWRKMQISDNLDFKPENYLLGFDTGRSIIV